MSEYAGAHPTDAKPSVNTISIPFVIAAAVLIGIGLFMLAAWLVTFNWLFFSGLLPTVGGGLLLFDRRAGSDRSP